MATNILTSRNFVLNYDNINNLLCQFDKISDGDKEITFDFSNTRWLSAELTTIFGALFQFLLDRECTVLVDVEFSTDVKTILQKNGFLSYYLSEEKIHDTFDTTIPYRVIRTNMIKTIDEYLSEKVLAKIDTHISSEEIEIIKNALYEIIHNIRDHAESDVVFMCGQYYPRSKQIVFTIADIGMTIPRKIRSIRKIDINDIDCIDWAIEKGHSTKTVSSSGLGLYDIMNNIRGRGSLNIISNKAFWEFNESEITTKRELTAPFPGTLIDISFSLNDNWAKNAYTLTEEFDLTF